MTIRTNGKSTVQHAATRSPHQCHPRAAERGTRLGAALILTLAVWLALAAAPALAAIGHSYLCQVTGTSPGSSSECRSGGSAAPGGLSNPYGVTISNGNVWAADPGHAAVDEFDSAGAFVSQQTGAGYFSSSFVQSVAVNESTQYLYVADSGPGAVDVFDNTGAFVAQWNGSSTPSGSFGGGYVYTAVDNSTGPSSGDVYVTDSSHGVIDKLSGGTTGGSQPTPVAFSGSASYISSSQITGTPGGPFGNLQGIAVDASGNIYAVDHGNDVVDEFDQTGTFVQQFTGTETPNHSFGTISGVGVDNATGNVYIVDSGQNVVDEFSSSGTYLDQITGADTPAGSFNGPHGVAVDSSGDVYVTDGGNHVVDKFGPDETIPDVTTTDLSGSVTNITQTSATLTGTVNPDGVAVTSCEFEYVSAADYNPSATDPYSAGSTAPCSPADVGSGTSPVAVSASITGLSESTVYHYRLVAANANGTNASGDQYFVTNGPGFGIPSFDLSATNADGSVDTQAGSHPYALTTSFAFNQTIDAGGNLITDGNVKDLQVDLPPGLIGNPTALPECSQNDLFNGDCPGASQVGVITITSTSNDLTGSPIITNPNGTTTTTIAVYNLVPPDGMPAEFGFDPVAELPVPIDFSVRTGGDYGVTTSLSSIPQTVPILSQTLTLWGEPADPSHDAQRVCAGAIAPPCSSDAPQTPFLTLPTSCTGPLQTTLQADSWQNPGNYVTASSTTEDTNGSPVGLDGCNQLDFSPTLSVQPDTTVADSPAGLAVDLEVPQNENPNGLAEANLKDAVVTLPAGVSVNPSSANGLTACTPAEIGLDNANEPSCPDASKIGSVEVDTPLLPDPLKGGLYFAQQTQNPFGSLLAIYLTAEANGVLVKLAGQVVPDPVTGQLTTTFSNNPQLPFTDFKLDFFGGPEGVLATPDACGSYTTTSSLSPWSGNPASSPSDSFSISSGCMIGFAPSFTAGTQNAQAGSYSPLVLSFQRSDTDQYLSGLSVTLPPGMLAKLAGVGECSEAQLASISSQAGTGAAQAANPSCPSGSQVGTVQTGAGTGPDPFFLPGKAYLTGPYKSAPYGLAVVVPAVAGPLDLGTVVVRQALHIDPTTAQVTAVSDPFPTILDGIPLRIRRIDVNLNRSDFTVNPTSCDPMSVTGTLTSSGGLSAPVSSRFQVGGCQELGFSPKLKMALTGKGKTRSGDHPTLTATVTQPSGQANLHTGRVTLPLSLALDPNNSQHVCSYDVAQAVHGGAVGCPAGTIVGSVTAVTPLLDQPLTGNVYLVQGIRFNSQGQRIRTLPSLLVPLRGQIALDLRAQTSVNAGSALVTTFSTIPDAPVSKFTLTITGGRKGLLVITGRGRTICGKSQVTNAVLGAQSGKSETENVTMSTPCGKAHKAKKHKKAKKKHSTKHAARSAVADRRPGAS